MTESATPEPDLIDRIADCLPKEERAGYYRELRHCRSLPESDEMLRILRAMQYLTLLMVTVPTRIADERQKFQTLYADAKAAFTEGKKMTEANQKDVERKLNIFPELIYAQIHPEAMASRLTANLESTFKFSTVTELAEQIEKTASEIRPAVDAFKTSAESISEAYKGSAARARAAIAEITNAITNAANHAGAEAERLSSTFRKNHKSALLALTLMAWGMGIISGYFLLILLHWLFP